MARTQLAAAEPEEPQAVSAAAPYRSARAAGMGAEEAADLVLAALADLDDHAGLAVHVVAPGRISVARTVRPRWAVVACLLTFWVAGLGLLFLLVRRTEAGELVVGDGPQGCVVSIPPLLDGPARRAIEEALASHGSIRPGPPVPPTSDAIDDADDLEARTVARRSLEDLPAPPTAPAAVPSLVLRFHAGTVAVAVGRPVVLGRDPSPTDGSEGRVAPGDTTAVSKSHLLVAFDGTTVTVQDLGSTNGSSVARGGRTDDLPAGVAVEVAHGDQVAMGVLAFTIDRSGAPA